MIRPMMLFLFRRCAVRPGPTLALVPVLALLFSVAFALGGCGAGPAGGLETRTFRLEHVEPGEMASLIEPYILSERGVLTVGTGTTPGLTVRERREILDRIGAMIAEYDRPRPTVVLYFQVIQANGFVESDPEIAEVEAALRELFRFKGYRLETEAVVRGSTRSEFTQILGGDVSSKNRLTLSGRIMEVRGGAENHSVRLNIVLADAWRTMLSSDLAIPIGQTVVLGSGQPTVGKGTLIVTVRPELVE